MASRLWFSVGALGLGLIALVPQVGAATERSRAELFGGYAYLRSDAPPRVLNDPNSHGWGVGVAANLRPWLALEGAADGHYGAAIPTGRVGPGFGGGMTTPVVYSFLAGPKLSLRLGEHVTPYLHSLFGAVHERVGDMGVDFIAADTKTGFASEWGGGVDVAVGRRWAVRVLEADYLRTSALGSPQNDARLSTGVVLSLGPRR